MKHGTNEERREGVTPTPETGLTEQEAVARRLRGLSNKFTLDPGKPVSRILFENFFNLFNLLNFALAAALIAVGSYRNMMFMGVVVSNTIIGTVQELRARNTLRRLRLLSEPTAHVLREGKLRDCKPEELVLGDLQVLRGGDQVLADGFVRSGSCLVNESLLTGESDAVSKQESSEVLSGSYLTEGHITMELTKVGAESYANQLIRDARRIRPTRSMLMTDLNRLVRLVSIVLLPLGALLFARQVFLSHAAIASAVPATVAAMLGMIPEGLILLTSVALAAGVVKLGCRGTLVQELYGIETLARIDTLCLDKTGTLTRGAMEVSRMIAVEADDAELHQAVGAFLGAFDDPSPTLEALRKVCPAEKKQITATLAFSSARKKSAVSFADGTTLVLGAPTFVLGDMRSELAAQVEAAAQEGLRVMVLAECKGTIDGENVPPISRVLGLACLTDQLRDNVEDTLQFFREQGVDIKVISGDDPRTVASIARRVGLIGWERYVDAATLDTDEKLDAAAERYVVFGRVTPVQKRRLVEALKRTGHSVGMTGDGVNDIPALKAADCSIAMAGGSDAAKNAAQLTLMNADFACMPQVVAEGRRVINNITRAASLYLVKTLFSFFLTVLLIFIPATYPFQPVQLTLVSAMTVGIPSFFLALEPNKERVRGKFLDTIFRNAMPGGVAVAVGASLSMAFGAVTGTSHAICSTMATAVAAVIGLTVLFRVCLPMTKLHAVLFGLMAAGLSAGMLFCGSLVYLQPLSGVQSLVLLALLALAGLAYWGVDRLMKRPGVHLPLTEEKASMNPKTPA